MGISIEHYRARIGIHTYNCMRMKNYLRCLYYSNLDVTLDSRAFDSK
jgi:hypothetical protein